MLTRSKMNFRMSESMLAVRRSSFITARKLWKSVLEVISNRLSCEGQFSHFENRRCGGWSLT